MCSTDRAGDAHGVVLVESDHPTLRATIESLLAGRYSVKADATSAVAALVDLDGEGGLAIVRTLRSKHATLPVIALTSVDSAEGVLDALAAGASGYLTTDRIAIELADALDAVQVGGTPLSPRIASHVVSALRDGKRFEPPSVVLTQAEHRVLEQLVRGLTYEQVGLVLGISINTVRTRVRTLYEKLGAMSRTEAVVHAARLGLIDIEA